MQQTEGHCNAYTPPQLHIHGADARKARTMLLHCTASCFRIAGRFQPSWDQGLRGRQQLYLPLRCN